MILKCSGGKFCDYAFQTLDIYLFLITLYGKGHVFSLENTLCGISDILRSYIVVRPAARCYIRKPTAHNMIIVCKREVQLARIIKEHTCIVNVRRLHTLAHREQSARQLRKYR